MRQPEQEKTGNNRGPPGGKRLSSAAANATQSGDQNVFIPQPGNTLLANQDLSACKGVGHGLIPNRLSAFWFVTAAISAGS